MPLYTLAADGDDFEKHYYPLFVQREFPHYETFWQKFITPLTRRPIDIQLLDDSELVKIGRTANDVCISQLHYSVLRHLARVYELRQSSRINVDHVIFGLSGICGAQDVAFELPERFQNPTAYDPWTDKRRGKLLGGREAQAAWKKSANYPLQSVRDYRNNLIHGRMLPGIGLGNTLYLPKMGKESRYFDWRKITNVTNLSSLPLGDFIIPADILSAAWDETIQYLQSQWASHLLAKL